VNVAGIGFDAHIANLFSNNKIRGLKTYIKLIFKELSYNAKDYIIKYNEKEEKIKAYFIAFANTSLYGNNMYISPNAKINDGLMDVVIVKEFPKWKIFLFLLRIRTKRIQKSRYVKIIKTKKINILSKDIITHIDGEPIKTTEEINVIVNSNNLKLFKPDV
jgi:diacylglycerol kinase family enzyme